MKSFCLVLLGFFSAQTLHAADPYAGYSYTNTALNVWTFADTNTWVSTFGRAPIAFTNIFSSDLGNDSDLVVDSTNAAFLQYRVLEEDGATNLTVDQGSVMFWVAPTSWSGTNEGGAGPGEWGRLIEVGAYTPEASYGWWSLYLDDVGCNLYFSAQGNDGSQATFLTAPIDWVTNRWHLVALTYSATNTALYLDGVLATNGSSVTVFPSPDVLTNGFFIGSASNGTTQAHAMFDGLVTYSYPLDAGTILTNFLNSSFSYYGNPINWANITSAPYTSSETPTFDDVTGAGFLRYDTNLADCVTNSSVWITNVVAKVTTNGMTDVIFGIDGGSPNTPYDVFATGRLLGPTLGSAYWAWLGQGYACSSYLLTNMPASAAFLVLGTPLDSDGDGMTDAYELLVNKTNPYNQDSYGDGVIDQPFQVFITNPQNGSSIP